MSQQARCIVPNTVELMELLTQISNTHYGGRFAPGTTLYDEYRPQGWRQAKAVCRAYGHSTDRIGWRNTCRDIGLHLPAAPRGVTFDPEIKRLRGPAQPPPPEECALDWPFEQLREQDRQFAAGMTAFVRQRPVRVWDIRAKRYVAIGYQEVYELR